MKSFCSECGAEHSYTLNKPKFCSQCGHALSFGSAAKPVELPQSDNINEIETTPEKFEVDILDNDGQSNAARRVPIEQIAFKGPTGFKRPKGKITKDKIIEEIQKTAIRPKPIDLPDIDS